MADAHDACPVDLVVEFGGDRVRGLVPLVAAVQCAQTHRRVDCIAKTLVPQGFHT